MATQDELNSLFRGAATQAESLLRSTSEDLVPYINVLKHDGELVTVMCPETQATVGTDPRARVQGLVKEVLDGAGSSVIAVAIVFDSRVRMEATSPPIDALLIELVTPEGPVGKYLRTYKREAGKVEFGKWSRLAK
jgi:hypothetical protein